MGWQWCAAFCTVGQLARFFPIMRTSFSRPRIRVFSFGNRHDGISFLGVQGLLDFLTKRTSHPKTRLAGCQPQGRLVSSRLLPSAERVFSRRGCSDHLPEGVLAGTTEDVARRDQLPGGPVVSELTIRFVAGKVRLHLITCLRPCSWYGPELRRLRARRQRHE